MNNPAVKSFEEMENMFSNTLPIEQLIFLELRDCDLTAGTPLYMEKVETLLRTTNSHHKAAEDKIYQNELKEAIYEVQDPGALLHNIRCNSWKQKKVKTLTKKDFNKIHAACLNFFSRHNITFKEERTSII